MAKTKSFAEKMLKSLKTAEDAVAYKVIKPKISHKGSVRYEQKIVKVKKGEDENKALGI